MATASSNQWSNNCAGGNVIKTAQQWGDLVRAMYPGYNGPRPRLQTYQGDADTTISYKNTGEAIKEWTNVLNLPTTPTSTQTGYKGAQATWNIQRWANACGYNVFEAWTAPGATHSMNYEEAEMLKFFGLDKAVGGPDPEPACSGGGGGASGTGGAGGATSGGGGHGGAAGAKGTGGATGTGGVVATGGSTGTGGLNGTGGSTGTGGLNGTGGKGGTTGSGGTTATGGSTGTGGLNGTGGSTGTGGLNGTGGTNETGGATGTGTGGSNTGTAGDSGTSGCSCAVGSDAQRSVSLAAPLLLALGLIIRRRRARR